MTITVTMLDTRMGEDSTLWTAGTEHEATETFAKHLVQFGWATATFSDVTAATTARGRVTAAGEFEFLDHTGAVIGGATSLSAIIAEYEAGTLGGATGGPNVAALFLTGYGASVFDAGSGNVMGTVAATINAATDVIAAERIQAASPTDAFPSTIDGDSTTGEVIALRSSTTGVFITSVTIGHAAGANMVLSTDATVTVNEMAKFEFDAADEVVSVRIYISPPRDSGRYFDISVVGQQA